MHRESEHRCLLHSLCPVWENAKDGLYPTDPRDLGKEVPIGQGKVDFPRCIAKLKAIGYTGPILIEREISGPQLIEDVRKSKVFLERLIREN